MWFEILPAFGIISAAIAAPHGIAYVLNYVLLGNCYRRLMESHQQRMQYLRDRRLTGNPYIVTGLENILDEQACEDDGSEDGNEEEPYEVVEEECEEEKCD